MLSKEAQVIETMFSIMNKQGEMVPYTLNPAQRAYDVQKTKRDLIPKARQKGFSSLGVAYQVVKCLGVPGTRAVLISHEAGATQRLLDKAHFYIKYLKGPQPEMGRHSRNELYFPKTESTYYIGTAGAKAFGRGDTITDLHISEYAWWEGDALRHVAGLMQAVPASGAVRIESTGNGRSNDFYYMCTHPRQLGYNCFFMPWWFDAEYEMNPPDEWTLHDEQTRHIETLEMMQERYNCSNRKLYWYCRKLAEFRDNINLMQQEYPSELEEAFQATGGGVFPEIERTTNSEWSEDQLMPDLGIRANILKGHPIPNYTYVVGGDPSGGTGHDDAAIQVICLDTLEQVFEFGSNRIDPVDFGYLLIKVAQHYNQAYINPEANNHGIATLSIIKKNYPIMKIYKRHISARGEIKYGFMTTESTKAQLVGMIKELWDEGITIYGELLYSALKAFAEDKDKEGKMSGIGDHHVMAFGMASMAARKYQRYLWVPPVEKKVIKQLNPNYMYYTFEECFERKQEKGLTLPFEDNLDREALI